MVQGGELIQVDFAARRRAAELGGSALIQETAAVIMEVDEAANSRQLANTQEASDRERNSKVYLGHLLGRLQPGEIGTAYQLARFNQELREQRKEGE